MQYRSDYGKLEYFWEYSAATVYKVAPVTATAEYLQIELL